MHASQHVPLVTNASTTIEPAFQPIVSIEVSVLDTPNDNLGNTDNAGVFNVIVEPLIHVDSTYVETIRNNKTITKNKEQRAKNKDKNDQKTI